MKYTCIKTVAIYLLTAFPLLLNASTQKVDIARSIMVGNGIAKFIPEGFDAKRYPLLLLKKNLANRVHSLLIGYLSLISHLQTVKQMHH